MSEQSARYLPTCLCPHVATASGLQRSGWSAQCMIHRQMSSQELNGVAAVGWIVTPLEQQSSRWKAIEAAARALVRDFNEHESVTQADIDALEKALGSLREGG